MTKSPDNIYFEWVSNEKLFQHCALISNILRKERIEKPKPWNSFLYLWQKYVHKGVRAAIIYLSVGYLTTL
jgi:hypothetical protein